jgi:insertion element IS1 protein InsB
VWIGVDRDAREYIDFTVGDRSTKTGMILWSKIEPQAVGDVNTDHWKSYNEMMLRLSSATIPAEKLKQNKDETNMIESFNGQIRHFLARFRRRTKCYSKSIEMMEYSLKLLMAKRNGMIYIYRITNS